METSDNSKNIFGPDSSLKIFGKILNNINDASINTTNIFDILLFGDLDGSTGNICYYTENDFETKSNDIKIDNIKNIINNIIKKLIPEKLDEKYINDIKDIKWKDASTLDEYIKSINSKINEINKNDTEIYTTTLKPTIRKIDTKELYNNILNLPEFTYINPPLLYDIKYVNNSSIYITDNMGNKELFPNAYKYLCNSYYRDDLLRYKVNISNNMYQIKCEEKNVKFNDIISKTFMGTSITTDLDPSTDSNDGKDSSTIEELTRDLYVRTYYDTFDETEFKHTIDSFPEIKKPYGNGYREFNTYWKILYYCQIIAQSQLYYTGVILDAVYDVINEQHLYTEEDPLYRCDIGADTTITSVTVYDPTKIECLYGLPPFTLKDSDVIININIPVRVKTFINETDTIFNKKWTIQQV